MPLIYALQVPDSVGVSIRRVVQPSPQSARTLSSPQRNRAPPSCHPSLPNPSPPLAVCVASPAVP